MSVALEVITRGLDTSGRYLRGTRQYFQHFDRVNEKVGGKLVIVQGAFVKGTAASAGTHDGAGCADIRVWNLTTDERNRAIRWAREFDAATWLRGTHQGFDPHIHWVLCGDAPMQKLALAQIDMYRKGYNGLGWYSHPDDFPYRPEIKPYQYLEDDMFEDADRATLNAIKKGLDTFRANELSRDQAAEDREKQRFSSLVTEQGKLADELGLLINSTQDKATKSDLRRMRERIIARLAEDPDVTGIDNPSPEGLQEL